MSNPIAIGYVVEQIAKDRLDALAANAGVSSAVMFEHIMATVVVTTQGVPATWPALPRDGELPIEAA